MSALLLAIAMVPVPTLAFEPPAESDGWILDRAEAVMAEQLRDLGYTVRSSSALTPARQDDVRLRLRSSPARVERATTSMTLMVEASGWTRAVAKIKGPAESLDRLTAALAASLARRLGAQDTTAIDLVEVPLPFIVHRQLGRAASRFADGQVRQAMLAYDQAGRAAKVAPLPSAIAGRRRAFQSLVDAGTARFEQRAELALASAETAEVATRKQDTAGARRAWASFLRYTDEYAERWRLPAALPFGARLIADRGDYLLSTRRRSWKISARTGVPSAERRTRRGLVSIIGSETLHLSNRVLSRRTARGRVRWRLRLPIAPVQDGVLTTSGLVGVLGGDTVVWADAGLGHLGQISRLTPPLATSSGGVLVRLPRQSDIGTEQIGLLRPGKRTPAWRATLPPVHQAKLTRDRVAVISDEGLHLLRTHNGRPARPLRAWPEKARWLHVSGRYGTAVRENRVLLFDVLAGRQTGECVGPSRPKAAITISEGVAVLFESGDVLQLDREGQILDRARPPGRPIQLVEGHPLAPGPIVLTTEGVYAYAEVRAGLLRDVDAYLALAQTMAASGDVDSALRLAGAVARRAAGRVAEAERLREALLIRRDRHEAADRARLRAIAASDPTVALGHSSVTGAPKNERLRPSGAGAPSERR